MAKTSPDEKIVTEARTRFKAAQEWESEARKLYVQDRKFANADPDNGWQWDDDVRKSRNIDARPCLTINKTRQHNLQIINDAKQNKPAVDIRPVGDGATYKAAQVFESITRHIEYISNAQTAYDTATTFQVEAGIGYWRIVTDYCDDESLDQEIFIRRVKDPLAIYLDPDITEADGSDARFGFAFDDMSRDEFEASYPQYKDQLPPLIALGNGDEWLAKDHVRVAEYYRRSEKADKLISMIGENGQRTTVRASKLPSEIIERIMADPETRARDVSDAVIEWYMIVGDKIVERNIWPGKYIPIVRVVGEETIIDGKLDRKGHTRALKDTQRQYNYWTSSAAEFVALQGKSPYVAPARAIEGLENYWETANTENHSVLPYNDVADDGTPIAPPQRSQPPVMAQAYISGMEIARQEMMEVSGQYQAMMGAPSNEISGKAITERQRQGDNATYHFIDNLALAVRFTGKILIDLIPKIYDTPRILRILALDGTTEEVELDPQAKQAYQEEVSETGAVVRRIFNPNVGKYDVQADIGPDYGTKRQEAFNAIMQVATQAPEIMQIAGDILFKAADFPMADELAERLQRMVPSQALGGPTPELQQAQGQIQQLQGVLQQMTEALADAKKKNGVDEYKAETDRLKLASDIDPLALVPVIQQAVMQALSMQSIASHPALPPLAPQPEPSAELDPQLLSQMTAQPQAQPQPMPQPEPMPQPVGAM